MKPHLKHLPTVLAGLSLTVLFLGAGAVQAQGTVNVICSTDQAWCDLAASEFQKKPA